MPMNPRLLRPVGSSFHPEANAWRTAVVAAGGSVSASTMKAVSTFCADIDKAGIRDRFYRLSLLCGNSDASVIAPRVPLYRGPSRTGTQYGHTIDTNVSFVQGDYAETGSTGGFTSNSAAGKRLLTGFKLNELPDAISSNHIGAFVFTHTASAANHWMIGSRNAAANIGFMRTSNGNGGQWLADNGNQRIIVYGTIPTALMISTRTSTTSHETFENATSKGTNTALASATPYDGDNWVFNVNNQGSAAGAYPFRLGGYTFGLGLTSSQVAALSAAFATFNLALNRT